MIDREVVEALEEGFEGGGDRSRIDTALTPRMAGFTQAAGGRLTRRDQLRSQPDMVATCAAPESPVRARDSGEISDPKPKM